MPLEINEQFTQFVQFANQQVAAGNDKAVARAGADVGAPARHVVAATDGDRVAAFTRSRTAEQANEAARTLFRQSVADMFGGEEEIPPNVRDAMQTGDYGKGKPLTARRILAVKTEVDRILAGPAAFNRGVAESLFHENSRGLPAAIRSALDGLADSCRAVFGGAVVPPGESVENLLNPSHVRTAIDGLIEAADRQGREISPQEIAGAFAPKLLRRLAATAAGEHILSKAREVAPDCTSLPAPLAFQFDKRNPGFLDSLCACRDAAGVAAVLAGRTEEIASFADLLVRSEAAAKDVKERAAAKLADALGLERGLVLAHVPFAPLRKAADFLSDAILQGTAEGSKEPGYDVEGAFEALVDDFVSHRIAACREIDTLDMPEAAKNRWKADYTGNSGRPRLTPSQLLQVAREVDFRKIEGALSRGMPMKIAAAMLENFAQSVQDAAIRATGNPDVFADAGVDDLMPLYGMLIVLAEAEIPSLAATVSEALKSFVGELDAHCEANKLGGAALFLRTLASKGGIVKEVPVTGKEPFLALVEEGTRAALAERGISDAKIRRDVEGAMRERAGRLLAGATGLGELSAFVSSLKDEAAALGDTLAAVARVRANARNIAATTVAAGSGLGKAYVLHNLDTGPISSASGKLRFLYDDVLAKARRGDPLDHAAALNKANDIVGKFALGKLAILREIDQSGFSPAERAAYRRTALRDADWTDPDLPKAARELAASASMKNAARLLASALRPEAAGTLDDGQLRNVFLAFAKAFVTTLKDEFAPYAQRWAGAVQTQQLLQEMMVRLLEKEQPGLASSLARLAAQGRLAKVETLIAGGLNEVRALKLDYMTLKQCNLLGPPAGEAVRTPTVMRNVNLQYSEAGYAQALSDDELYDMATGLFSAVTADFPSGKPVDADRAIAFATKGRETIAKYAGELAEEAVPVLERLVRTLDWREGKAEASEGIVARYVEDMKTWRDVAAGSAEAKGLEAVFLRRTNGYLEHVLAHAKYFPPGPHPGLFDSFVQDLTRCTYSVNGKTVPPGDAASRLAPFEAAIPDPAKRKAVSVMINQQLFGEFTASVANRQPLPGWKDGMADEPVEGIPGIGNFAARDVTRTGYQLFDTGPMEFAIEVAPDGNSVSVRAKSAYPLHADVSIPKETVGTCRVTQEFVIDFTGAAPAIRDFKIAQALS